MLILARKENEEILIGNDIKVVIVNISKNTVVIFAPDALEINV